METRVRLDDSDVEYAGFRIRLAAAVIDSIIVTITRLIISAAGLNFIELIDISVGFLDITFFGFTYNIAGMNTISMFYGVLFIGLRGQTPGKSALGIQVVNAQGNVPGLGKAFMREVVGKIASTIPLGLGFLWVGWNAQKRGWHDYIGNTYVIRAHRAASDTSPRPVESANDG